MKIVYIGKCDLMASKLVDRLVKEENDVYIISLQDFAKNVKPTLAYKLYSYQSNNIEIEKVFKSIHPDQIIFAGEIYLDNIWEYSVQTNNYLSQLVNILNESVINHINKFIYLSSGEVYDPSSDNITEESKIKPATYKGILCSQGEDMVLKFHELYKIDTVILRISSVYGCPVGNNNKDFVSDIVHSFYKTGEYKANKNKQLFPVHIKDAVEAVYRAKGSTPSLIYNVGDKDKISDLQIATLLNHALGDKYKIKEESGDHYYYDLDTSKIKEELEWVQFYSLPHAISAQEIVLDEKIQEAPKVKKAHKQNSFSQSIENVLLFLFFVLLTIVCEKYSVLRTVDLFYIYIILMSLMFGVKQSILSVILSSGFFIFHSGMNATTVVDVLVNIDSILKIAEYIFMGIVVGYSVDQYKARVHEKDLEYEYLENEYREIKEINDDNIIIKQEYERRLLNYKTSLPKLYSIISQLSVLEPEKIFSPMVNVIKDVMDTNTVSVYLMNNKSKYARLVVSLNAESVFHGNSFNLDDFPKIKSTLYENEIFIGTQWDPNEPSLVAPVFHKGQCIAIIIINEMAFQTLTLYNINLFRTLTVLITSSIVKAIEYEEAIRANKYLEHTEILVEQEFKKLVDIKKEEQKQGLSHFKLIHIDSKKPLLETYETIRNVFRNTDFFGVNDKNQLFVLLGNTKQEDVKYVLKRLESKGICIAEVQ